MPQMKKKYTPVFKEESVIESYRCENIGQFAKDIGVERAMLHR